MISKHGQIIRLNVKQIPSQGRATQGVYLLRLRGDDRVSSVSLIRKEAESKLDASDTADSGPSLKAGEQLQLA